MLLNGLAFEGKQRGVDFVFAFCPLNSGPKCRMQSWDILFLKCLQSCVRSSEFQCEINLISSNQKPEVTGRSVDVCRGSEPKNQNSPNELMPRYFFFLYNPQNPYGVFWHLMNEWLEAPHTFTLTAQGEFRQSWACFIINCNSTALQTAENLGDEELRCGLKGC